MSKRHIYFTVLSFLLKGLGIRNSDLFAGGRQLRVMSGTRSYRGRLVSVSDGILDGGVEMLERLIVVHLSLLNSGCVATGACLAEFLKLSRQIAIGVL